MLKPAITRSIIAQVPTITFALLTACVQAYLLLADTVSVRPITPRPGESSLEAMMDHLDASQREQEARYALFAAIHEVAPEVAAELRYIGSIKLGTERARVYHDGRVMDLCSVLGIDKDGLSKHDEFDILDAAPNPVIIPEEEPTLA